MTARPTRRRLLAGLAALPALLPLPARAHSYRHGAIVIGHAWAPPAAEATEAYLALVNAGAAPDRLLSATTPAAAAAGLRHAGGAALAFIDLQPGRGANLRPGGAHVALEGLLRPLETGGRIPLTLGFAAAGPVEIEVWIESAPYAGAG